MESTEFTAKKRPARAKRSSPPPTGRDSSGRGSGSGNTMRLCVPADGKAGDVLRINTSTGRVLSVAVPAGLKAGDSFEVRVPPSAAPPPTTSPLARKTSSLAMQRKASSDALTRKFSSAFVGGNVAELVACGFSAQVAKKALELVKKNPTTASTKEAEMDHVINECLRLQGEEEAKATQLAALGFSEAKAQVALEKCNGNMEAAAEWLLENESMISDSTLLSTGPASFRHPHSLSKQDLSAFFGTSAPLSASPAASGINTEQAKGDSGTRHEAPATAELPPLAERPVYDRDMVARLEYKQRSANYATTQLAPEAVAARRAFSARLHSHHQRSLLDVTVPSPAPSSSASNQTTQSVETALSGIEGLTFVEEEDSEDDEDEEDEDGGGESDKNDLRYSAVLDLDAHVSFTDKGAVKSGNHGTTAMDSVSAQEVTASLEVDGFGAAWRHFTGPVCNHMTASMLRDDPIAVAQAGYKELTDQALADTCRFEDTVQASLFRRAVLRAHKYPFPTHVTVGVDLTKPLGMVVDDDLYVIDEVVPSTQAELCGVQRGWQLVAVGSFAVATTPELMEALKQYREGLQALRAMAAQGNGSTAAADAAQVALGFVTTEATAAADACSQSTSSSWASSPATPPPPSAPAPSPPPSARSQMAPELSREDAIVQGRERLTKRLASETLKEAEMEDDGNCQFRALSSECYGTQRYHRAIRLKVVQFIEEQAEEFAPFFPGDAFSEYCASMRMPGTWGDELTLRAAADLLKAKVYVITSEPENWLLQYDPPEPDPASKKAPAGSAERCLFVTYISPIHYNTIEHDTSAFVQSPAALPGQLNSAPNASSAIEPGPKLDNNPPLQELARREALL